MIEKIICKECGKGFNSEESKNQHQSAVHGVGKKGLSRKGFKKWAILFVLVLGLGYVLYWGIEGVANEDDYCQNQLITEMNIGSHQNLLNHIHQELEIEIDGVTQPIPSDVGIDVGIMRPIHTHDSSGEIHVEGPCVRDFTLEEFFILWGKTFNKGQILDKTSDQGEIKLYVNGKESNAYENLVLRDDQEIKILFNSY